MTDAMNPASMVVWGGFVLAFIFRVVANKTNFCTMGAIPDVVNMAHWGRIRMWLLAIAVAMIGTNLLYYFGLIDLSKSIYVRPSLPWLSLVVGGVSFGIGMTIARFVGLGVGWPDFAANTGQTHRPCRQISFAHFGGGEFWHLGICLERQTFSRQSDATCRFSGAGFAGGRRVVPDRSCRFW